MGLFKGIGNIVGGITGSLAGGLGQSLGIDTSGVMSGVPFIGQGFAQRSAQQFNASEADKNRQFQEFMSSSAHQRQVKDLKAAGLNPILSAGGSGVAMASGATASVSPMSGASDSANFMKSLLNKERQKATADIELSQQMKNTQKSAEASNITSAQKAKSETNILKLQESLQKEETKYQKEVIKKKSPTIDAIKQQYLPFVNSAATFGGIGIAGKAARDIKKATDKFKPKQKFRDDTSKQFKQYRNDKNAPF